MRKIQVTLIASLALLTGCVQEDLSWKDQLKEQQEQLDAQQKRLDELSGKYDGLKKSETPFMLVMVDNPVDTVTKGLDFNSLFRVNPSGIQLTKEMIALDCVSSKRFFSTAPNTKASYIKPSESFSLKDLAADKNASGELLEGQYVATLTSATEETVWDESRMAFVGAYVDKEGKAQYISSEVFKTVMMPLPHEGLDLWAYPHASLYIKQKGEESLGAVYIPMDGKAFTSSAESESRFYSSNNLSGASFALDEGCTAPVSLEFIEKKHYLKFTPDTTGSETWRAFCDTTKLKRQIVSGTLSLKDRWGGESWMHLQMAWYNKNLVSLSYEVSAEELVKGFHLDLTEVFNAYGLDAQDLNACYRPFPTSGMDPSEEDGNLNLYFQDGADNPSSAIVNIEATPIPGKTYSTRASVCYGIFVQNSSDADDAVPCVILNIELKVTIKKDPIENLGEKLIGEWTEANIDAEVVPTDSKKTITVVSATKAYSNLPLDPNASLESKWNGQKTELDVTVEGDIVTFKEHEGNYSIRMKVEVIDDIQILFYPIEAGETTPSPAAGISSWVKNTQQADYSQDIIRLWECDEEYGYDWVEHQYFQTRIAFKADGTYDFYKQDKKGLWKPVEGRTGNQYLLNNASLGMRWQEEGQPVTYEWWDIERIFQSKMTLTSYRRKDTGKVALHQTKWVEVVFPTQEQIEQNIIGKWVTDRMNTKALPTDETSVITFLSLSKATLSASLNARTEVDPVWDHKKEVDVAISGNVITVTNKINEHKTVVTRMIVTRIDGVLMSTVLQMTDYLDGQVAETHPEVNMQYKRIGYSFEQDILGVWEGKVQGDKDTYGDGKPHRWEYKADGTYVYYVQDGNKWVPSSNTLNEYFVDGDKLCMRWKDGGKEYREWWEIAKLESNEMTWSALRKDETGTSFTSIYTFERIN